MSFPLAVHISDGVLTPPWWLGGFAVAGLLAWLGAWRIREEEIPHVALLTAAFFVASLIHVKVGPTSVHLLLNGLVGAVLGRRAALAIPIGVAMQAALLFHGGFTTIGINSCIMVAPALVAWQLFHQLHRLPTLYSSWVRGGLVSVSAALWIFALIYSVALLSTNPISALDPEDPQLNSAQANAITFHPVTVLAALVLAGAIAWIESRLENAPEFPLGLFVGETAVLATTALNCLVLLWGGQEDWHTLALLVFVAHLPVAVIEGIVVGFAVGFLARVKPELLDWSSVANIRSFDGAAVASSRNGAEPTQRADKPISLPEQTR
jgi:cobalt/nickel transport system permease protein